MTEVKKIYKAMQGVMRDVCETGIGKNSKTKTRAITSVALKTP